MHMLATRIGKKDILWGLRVFSRHKGKKNKKVNEYEEYEHTIRLEKLKQLRLKQEYMNTPIHYQTSTELVQTVHLSSQLQIHNPNLWTRCSIAIQDLLTSFKAKDLATIVNAFAKAHFRDKKLFHALAKPIAINIPSSRLTDLTVIIQSYATLRIPHAPLFSLIGDHIHNQLSQLSPRGISLLLHSYCVLRIPHHLLFERILKEVPSKLYAASIDDLCAITASLSELKQWYGEKYLSPPSSPSPLSSLAHPAEETTSLLDKTKGEKERFEEAYEKIYKIGREEYLGRLSQFSVEQSIGLLRSLVSLTKERDREILGAFEGLLSVRLGEVGVLLMPEILRVFAMFPETDLSEILMRRVVNAIVRDLDVLSLDMAVSAMASLRLCGFFDENLEKRFYECVPSRLESMNRASKIHLLVRLSGVRSSEGEGEGNCSLLSDESLRTLATVRVGIANLARAVFDDLQPLVRTYTRTNGEPNESLAPLSDAEFLKVFDALCRMRMFEEMDVMMHQLFFPLISIKNSSDNPWTARKAESQWIREQLANETMLHQNIPASRLQTETAELFLFHQILISHFPSKSDYDRLRTERERDETLFSSPPLLSLSQERTLQQEFSPVSLLHSPQFLTQEENKKLHQKISLATEFLMDPQRVRTGQLSRTALLHHQKILKRNKALQRAHSFINQGTTDISEATIREERRRKELEREKQREEKIGEEKREEDREETEEEESEYVKEIVERQRREVLRVIKETRKEADQMYQRGVASFPVISSEELRRQEEATSRPEILVPESLGRFQKTANNSNEATNANDKTDRVKRVRVLTGSARGQEGGEESTEKEEEIEKREAEMRGEREEVEEETSAEIDYYRCSENLMRYFPRENLVELLVFAGDGDNERWALNRLLADDEISNSQETARDFILRTIPISILPAFLNVLIKNFKGDNNLMNREERERLEHQILASLEVLFSPPEKCCEQQGDETAQYSSQYYCERLEEFFDALNERNSNVVDDSDGEKNLMFELLTSEGISNIVRSLYNYEDKETTETLLPMLSQCLVEREIVRLARVPSDNEETSSSPSSSSLTPDLFSSSATVRVPRELFSEQVKREIAWREGISMEGVVMEDFDGVRTEVSSLRTIVRTISLYKKFDACAKMDERLIEIAIDRSQELMGEEFLRLIALLSKLDIKMSKHQISTLAQAVDVRKHTIRSFHQILQLRTLCEQMQIPSLVQNSTEQEHTVAGMDREHFFKHQKQMASKSLNINNTTHQIISHHYQNIDLNKAKH